MNRSKKTSRTRLTVIVSIAVALGGVGLWAHIRDAHLNGHSHGHDSPDATALALNQGQRWQTDQALRTGMQRIRAAARILGPGPAGTVAPNDAKQFAATVQASVEYLMKNCRLEPKADAALHVILTDLLTGAASLAENPSSAEARSQITRALQRYPEYFDDPGWQPMASNDPHR